MISGSPLLRVYPRECGGTQMWEVFNPDGDGLSPRVRGNRWLVNMLRLCIWSIPASAGEPRIHMYLSHAAPVYPRECGGTDLMFSVFGTFEGLSPRVRGNQPHAHGQRRCRRSIPASAGEP